MRKVLMCAILGTLAVAVGCGIGSSSGIGTSNPTNSTPATPGNGTGSLGGCTSGSVGCAGVGSGNVAAIIVDAGPAALQEPAYNEPFVTLEVCVHGAAVGSASCQIIDHVLVDTGSTGLRLLSTAGGGELPTSLGLTPVTDSSGNPITECGEFVSSVVYGSVRYADVYVAGETTVNTSTTGIPIQVIGDSGSPASSQYCGSALSPVLDTLQTLGYNGILGIGYSQTDCLLDGTNYCATAATSTTIGNFPELYYSCPTLTSCTFTTTNSALIDGQQLLNPVLAFPTDYQGTIIELPTIASGGQANVGGALVFGINTQTDNALGSAAVFTIDPTYGYFSTSFGGNTYASVIDSGSNAYYVLTDDTSGLKTCISFGADYYFCPSNTVSLSGVQNAGTNGVTANVGGVDIESALTLLNTTGTAFNDLGGPNCSVLGSNDLPSCGPDNEYETWDWGLPFFFGRHVFNGIESGTAAPFVAY